MAIKKIGVLTSGGDCSGLNAAIRAVTYHAISAYNWEVYGIYEGTVGLLERPLRYEKLDYNIFKLDLLRKGGTFLGTVNKGDPFNFPMADGSFKDRSGEIINGFKELGLDALVGIGGDGSMRILNRLSEQGNINFVGIPKTIDNDVPLTEMAIGFQTAVNVAVDAIDRLRDTAFSHSRVMVVEVMGRDAGHIALNAGVAGGANVILIPEIPYSIDKICDHLKKLNNAGRKHAVVVVSEAIRSLDGSDVVQKTMVDGEKRYGGIGQVISDEIQKRTGIDSRVTTLGHVQRGGVPCALDRTLATAFGVHAVDLLAKGLTGRVVVWQNQDITNVALKDMVNKTNPIKKDSVLMRAARGMGICFGD